MQIHKTKNGIKFVRENWKEWFHFIVCFEMYQRVIYNGIFPIPRWYIKSSRRDFMRAIDHYYIFFLIPFVELALFLDKMWWKLARFVWKKGYLRVSEGEQLPYFWPKRITLKKISTPYR